MSRTWSSLPRNRTSQCCPEIDDSRIWKALLGPRPMVTQCPPNSCDNPACPLEIMTSLAIQLGLECAWPCHHLSHEKAGFVPNRSLSVLLRKGKAVGYGDSRRASFEYARDNYSGPRCCG